MKAREREWVRRRKMRENAREGRRGIEGYGTRGERIQGRKREGGIETWREGEVAREMEGKREGGRGFEGNGGRSAWE